MKKVLLAAVFAYFNSIKVRLELPYLCIVVSLILFQFHKGAIRTSELAQS